MFQVIFLALVNPNHSPSPALVLALALTLALTLVLTLPIALGLLPGSGVSFESLEKPDYYLCMDEETKLKLKRPMPLAEEEEKEAWNKSATFEIHEA